MKSRNLLFIFFALMILLVGSTTIYAVTEYPYWIQHDENGNPYQYLWTKVSIPAHGSISLNISKAPYEDNPIISNGLVAWYKLNGNAVDSSGNSYDGTVNGATSTTDRFGNTNKAMSFDGSTYISVSKQLPSMSSATVSAWIYADTGVITDPSGWHDIIFDGDTTAGHDFSIQLGENSIHLRDNSDGDWGVSLNDPSSYENKWIQIVGVYDSINHMKSLYIDGKLIASESWNGTAHTGYFYYLQIGRLYDGGSAEMYFKGSIDDVRIYDRALTPQEVWELYTASAYHNGNKVFPFFDDFNYNDLSNYSTNGGTYSISNGKLSITGVSDGNSVIAPTTQPTLNNYEVNILASNNVIDTAKDNLVGVLGFKSTLTGNDGYVCQYGSLSSSPVIDIEKYTVSHLTNTAISYTQGNYYSIAGIFVPNNITAIFDNSTSTNAIDSSFTSGTFGIRTFNANAYVDYIFARKNSPAQSTILVQNTTNGYIVKITNPGSTDLINYSVPIPLSDFATGFISSEYQPLSITSLTLELNVEPKQIYVNTTTAITISNSQPTSQNATLLIEDNNSNVLYNTSMTINAISSAILHYTIPQSEAHNTLTFEVEQNGTIINSLSLPVLNTPPTAPTNIGVEQAGYVDKYLKVAASGSTDIDNDNLTYYYKFVDFETNTTLQDWSVNNTYLVPKLEAHKTIKVEAKAYDGENYSKSFAITTGVKDTPPQINSITEPKVASKSEKICISWNVTDIDGDNTTYLLKVYGIGYWIRDVDGSIDDVNISQSFTPMKVYSLIDNYPAFYLAGISTSNDSYCFTIPRIWGFENDKGKYFDGFIFVNLTATDLQNPLGDGLKSTTEINFNSSKLGTNLTAFKDSTNLTYVYSANITYCLINEIDWSKWDLSVAPISIQGYDLYRGGSADTDSFNTTSGSCQLGTPVNRLYRHYVYPFNEYVMHFFPNYNTSVIFTGSRSLEPFLNSNYGTVPVLLLYTQDQTKVLSPQIEYVGGSAPQRFEVYTYHDGVKYIISQGITNPNTASQYPQFPLIYSNLYYFVLDGNDYGLVPVSTTPLIFKQYSSGSLVPVQITLPVKKILPLQIEIKKNETITFNFVDVNNQYPYWGYTLIFPNGTKLSAYAPHSQYILNRTVYFNKTKLGDYLLAELYGFNSEPSLVNTTINESNNTILLQTLLGSGKTLLLKQKIPIMNFHITSLADIGSGILNLFSQNRFFAIFFWIGLVLIFWFAVAMAGLGLASYSMALALATILMSSVLGVVFTIIALLISTGLFIISIIQF